MPRNDAAAPGNVCPGIRIHAIDIVQPPGIGISPIADIDAHQTMVAAALAAKSSAETPRNACLEDCSEDMASVSACRTRRGGATRRPSRCVPWVRGRAIGTCPEAVHSARIGGIGVVDDAVLE